MVVLNDKDVRQKTGVILEQKSNLMGEETGMDKKWTLHVENFDKNKKCRCYDRTVNVFCG